MKITYEWCIEERDEFGDCENLDFEDSLRTLLKRTKAAESPHSQELCLVRSEYDDCAGIGERWYAYPSASGAMEFDTPDWPPTKKHCRELAANLKAAQALGVLACALEVTAND